jgi:hypothetical protein
MIPDELKMEGEIFGKRKEILGREKLENFGDEKVVNFGGEKNLWEF